MDFGSIEEGAQTVRKKASFVLIALGAAFVAYAILGRYLVIPGYIESLERGSAPAGSLPADVSPWKIARYLLWAYAFKFGMYFIALGALSATAMKGKTLALYGLAGFFYIAVAYMPLPGPSALFGIGGAVMTGAIIAVFARVSAARDRGQGDTPTRLDLRLIGYFFFAMATYNLCPLLGTRCFALSPELMIKYGLQADAASFASHVLIELTAGWCFVAASYLAKRVGAAPRT